MEDVPGPTTPAATSQQIIQSSEHHHQTDSSTKISSSKQRQRTRRACYPCSKRKIKCDRDERIPCTNCAKRPNSEQCGFDDERPRSARPRHSGATASPTPGDLGVDSLKNEPTPPSQLLRGLQNSGHNTFSLHGEDRKLVLQPGNDPLRAIVLDPKPPPTSLHKHSTSVPRYSVVPEALPTPPPATHTSILGSSFVPVNSLAHTSAAPPQLPIPGSSTITAAAPLLRTPVDEIRALCPPIKHVTKYCEIYSMTAHDLYPVDVGIPHVQELSFQYIHGSMVDRLISFLETRNFAGFREEAIRLALLCASVAVGIQVSDSEEPSRKSLLRQYTAQAMKLIRIADAQSTASLAAYPVMLMISRLVQDECEPLLSWSLLGSAKRLAQMYAIITPWPDCYSEEKRHLRDSANLLRVRQRQESFLAVILGQTQELERGPFPDTRGWSNASYLECLDVFAALAAFSGSEDISREDLFLQHIDAMQAIQPLDLFAQPYLADKDKCQNVRELTQYCILRIHERLVILNYCQIIMAACRRISNHQEEYFRATETCLSKARECVDTYVHMLTFSIIPLRSWILTVTALRAALILGVLMAESNASITAAAPDRDRLNKLIAAFTTVHDETQADRARWLQRYTAVFRRLQEMCDLSVKPSDARASSANGVLDTNEQVSALQWMSRDDKDDIMLPSRMVRAYFAVPSVEDPSLGLLLSSQQLTFDV